MMGGFAAQQGNMQQQGMMNQQPGYGQQQQMGGFSGMGASNYGQQPQQLQMQSGNIQGQYGQQSFASPLPNVSMPQQQQQSQGYSSQGFPGLQPQQQLQSQLPGMIGIQRQLTSGSMSGAPLSPKSTRASISAEPPKNLASLGSYTFRSVFLNAVIWIFRSDD
ncbi:hypothetical protein BC829DRAFT_407029 [Chytridium lagenaria]|nr:hypothetical protein BC829DRAFT_407029 [Chytridium lagenaria]